MWMIKPLEGKYYGTKIVNWETDDIIEVWLPFKTYTQDEVSEREKELGWGEDGEYYFDHVESQHSYEAAKKIVKALNDEKNCTGHRNEHGSRYDPFVRNSGH